LASQEFGVPIEYIAAIGLTEFSQARDAGFLAMNIPTFEWYSWRTYYQTPIYKISSIFRTIRFQAVEEYNLKMKILGGGRVGTFGNMHGNFPIETMAIIRDNFSMTPNLVSIVANINATNDGLKDMQFFSNYIKEDISVISFNTGSMGNDEKDSLRVRTIGASLAAFGILWELDLNSSGTSIKNRPEILGTLYNMGWASGGKLNFVPKKNPQPSDEMVFSVIIDGKPYGRTGFGERVKMFAESERMKRFVSGEDPTECKINFGGKDE
jgi:hypothetical protein